MSPPFLLENNMQGLVGVQSFTADGTISPLAITRIWSVDFACSVSASSVALYNSTTNTALFIRVTSDSQGVGHQDWPMGLLVPNSSGIFVMTGAGSTVTKIMYQTEA